MDIIDVIPITRLKIVPRTKHACTVITVFQQVRCGYFSDWWRQYLNSCPRRPVDPLEEMVYGLTT